ncbi:hypothetical protein AB0420_29745 [Streptomyces caelestis]|uniref:Lipoprotein n=1 Tax=Streptomyces heliomycini TaxID=284032 RepID=A0ABV5LHA7_9ACTN|nr:MULTISPECIES: hypothetical protein [unclassified Streptomyces]KOV19947.1 membrane protein [Streptomyces sp. XY152]
MANEWVRGAVRCAVGVMGVVAVLMPCGTPAGSAHADETDTASHDGHRVGPGNADAGRADAPAQDVREHLLPFGDGHARN